MDLIIDQEISGCQRQLSHEEYEQLQDNILADGKIIDPIVVWKGHGIVVDGENRYGIAKKHSIPYEVEEREFADKTAVKLWIHKHQLGRRNLDGVAATIMRGKMFEEVGDVDVVAETFGVSSRQVYRDAQVAKVVEDMPEDLQERISKGALVASDRAVRRFGELDVVQKARVVNELRKDPSKALHEALPTTKPKVQMTDADRELVQETFSPGVRQKIALGKVTAAHSDLQKLAKLDAVNRELIDDVLAGGEVLDVGEAIDLLNVKPERKSMTPLDAGKLRNRIADTFALLKRLVDDLGSAIGKNVEPVQDALKIAESNMP